MGRIYLIVVLVFVVIVGIFLIVVVLFVLWVYVEYNLYLIVCLISYIIEVVVVFGDMVVVNEVLLMIVINEEVVEVKIMDVNGWVVV